jgi:hypothetical protein
MKHRQRQIAKKVAGAVISVPSWRDEFLESDSSSSVGCTDEFARIRVPAGCRHRPALEGRGRDLVSPDFGLVFAVVYFGSIYLLQQLR